MDLPLFQIRNLTCSYNNSGSKSLYVEQLDIPWGKQVFLLGASGAGKSTLLETLGLMNNTIDSGEVLFYEEVGITPVDFNQLWQSKRKGDITSIRKKYFSFIFQNTNLMENFTAYENVCLSGMIKQDLTQEKVLPQAKALMNIVKLPESEVSLSTLAGNLSGGQRQRLSFVRALNNSAKVLFCDEPTGNLDEVNADELFNVIKNHIQGEKSAIIVSHDIDLALKHADVIIVISKDTSKGYGEIIKENIYERSLWESNTEEENKVFVHKIRDLFITGQEQIITKKEDHVEVDIKSNYRRLFYKKEGNILAGKKRSNLIVLTVILFFTFLSIGFANGCIDYLNKMLQSAFVNWVTISIPYTNGKDKVHSLIKLINQPENQAKYNCYKASTYLINPLFISDAQTKETIPIAGRSVDLLTDDKLLKEFVLEDKNFIRGSKLGFHGDRDISVIVSERMLRSMHYPMDADFLLWEVEVDDTLLPIQQRRQKVILPLPIRSVVKKLPGQFGLLFPIHFFKAYFNDHGEVFSNISNTKYLYGFIKGKTEKDIPELKKSIVEFSNNYKWNEGVNDSVKTDIETTLSSDTPAIHGGLKLQIEFYPNLINHRQMDTFWAKLMNIPVLKPLKKIITRTYYFGLADAGNNDPNFDQISVHFKNLDRIRDFSTFIYSQNDSRDKEVNKMEIDETKIRDKENFNFLSTVTAIISTLLIIFSTVAISLFIFNLLKMHLLKVKMNLGTFKAIGLGENETRNIYFFIIISFIAISSLVALVLASFAGELLNSYLISNLILEEDVKYFKIFDWVTFATLLVILITSVLVSWFTINKIISKSPGDLIYNR